MLNQSKTCTCQSCNCNPCKCGSKKPAATR